MFAVSGAPLCVFCRRKPADPAWRPFCSDRCKVRDLAQWADGTYRVAGEPASEDEHPDNPESQRALDV